MVEASTFEPARHLLSQEQAPFVSNHTLKHECPDIYLDDHAMDIKFAPSNNILAVAQITGEVRIYAYSETEMDQVLLFNNHKESVRSLDYNPTGNILYCASKDCSFSVISNGCIEGVIKSAHKESINKIIHIENDHIVATGDDDGLIKIWDLRMATQMSKACVMELNEHEGTISDMVFAAEHSMLLTSSNDGMLGVFDLRKGSLYAMSDNFEEDQNAVCMVKSGKKVLTATGQGIINIFSWDWFGDCNDRITSHPGSVDTMIKYDEDTVITGCEDGLIRAVSILPNRVISILGDPIDTEDEIFHI